MYDTGTLADRMELQQVIWTLGRCLDERDFDGLRQIFTTDAAVTTRETASGLDALVDQARRRHSRDDGIQHIITNLITDVDGDQATGRANLLVSFAHTGPADPAPLLVGEVYRFTFRRTPHGWRITRLTSTVTWSLNPATLVTAASAPSLA
jgi:SnoaL-like domain